MSDEDNQVHVHGPGCSHEHAPQKPIQVEKRPGRNDPCWCGSGTKYKKCHLQKDE